MVAAPTSTTPATPATPPATTNNWQSGFASAPITTPTPVRDFGQTGGDQWGNTIGAVGEYYVDPWGVTHSGLPMDAQGNVLDPSQANQASRIWFSNFPTSERTGTAALQYGWKDPAWASQNVQQSAYQGPDGALLGQMLPKGTQGFSIAANALSQLPGQLAQTGRQNTQYANKSPGTLSQLAPILGLAAMFVPGLQPFAAALNIGQGISSGNIGQALSGALGLPGVGNAVTGAIGAGLSDLGVSSSFLPYATKGVMGAGSTLLSGGSPTQALVNGLASGTGSYAGSQVRGALSGMPDSIVNGLSQATAGALGSAIKGGNIGEGALFSGLNGIGQGYGISGVGSGLRSLLNNQQQQRSVQAQSSARAKLAARLAALRG